jgi:hypothetical protein
LSAPAIGGEARLGLVGVAVFWFIMIGPTAGWSEIIRHVDANGVIWFTNTPSSPGAQGGPPATVETTRQGRVKRTQIHPYRAEVEQLAHQHALSPHLVNALIAVESDFDPEAISPKGAQGLMQLMPMITRHYRVYNPFDPQQNIAGGIRYLSDLLRLFDNKVPLALAAYNGGEGLVRRHGGVPPLLESYVNKVLTLYEQVRGNSIHRYLLPSGMILFSNVPLSQEQQRLWEVKK